MTPKLKRTIIAWLLLSPLIVVTFFPFAVMFLTAVKPRQEVLSPTWWPSEFRWSNFSDMWVATGFGRALANSLYVSVIATVGAILISVPAAYAMSRFRFAGYGAFRQFLLISQMISPIVLVLGLFRLMAAWGLVESTTARQSPEALAKPNSLALRFASSSLTSPRWTSLGLATSGKTAPTALHAMAWHLPMKPVPIRPTPTIFFPPNASSDRWMN